MAEPAIQSPVELSGSPDIVIALRAVGADQAFLLRSQT
jgi:hypothetical protein